MVWWNIRVDDVCIARCKIDRLAYYGWFAGGAWRATRCTGIAGNLSRCSGSRFGSTTISTKRFVARITADRTDW